MSIVSAAKAAGVSASTVARVINRHPSVSPQTIKKVQQAMREINYEPPPPVRRRGPRTLKNQGFRTRNIAKLFIAMDETHLRAMTAPGSAAEALARYGLNLVFVPMPDPEKLPAIIDLKHVDGVIVQGMEPVGKAAEALRGLPAVWMMTRRSDTFWVDYVQPDNTANGRMAAQYLLDRGHQQLGVVNLQPNYPAFRQRFDAFMKLAKERGASVVAPPPELVDPSEVLHPEGWQEIIKIQIPALLDRNPGISGIYLTNLIPLAAVYRELRARGREPGRDVDVITGDYNSEVIFNFDPPPVCMDVQISAIAERVVDQLVWRIRNPGEPGPVGISMPPRLVVSGLVGREN